MYNFFLQVGAKFTNAGIACDEFAQPDLNLSFEGKRDRWNGYDPSEHKVIIEEYQKIEEAKRELRAKRLEQGNLSNFLLIFFFKYRFKFKIELDYNNININISVYLNA